MKKRWIGGPLDGLIGDEPSPLINGTWYGPDPADTRMVVVYDWNGSDFVYNQDETNRLNAPQRGSD